MKKKYEFMIEELCCYSITLEVEPDADPDVEEERAWDEFHAIECSWCDHDTFIEEDTQIDVQIYPVRSKNYETSD